MSRKNWFCWKKTFLPSYFPVNIPLDVIEGRSKTSPFNTQFHSCVSVTWVNFAYSHTFKAPRPHTILNQHNVSFQRYRENRRTLPPNSDRTAPRTRKKTKMRKRPEVELITKVDRDNTGILIVVSEGKSRNASTRSRRLAEVDTRCHLKCKAFLQLSNFSNLMKLYRNFEQNLICIR